MKVIYGNGRKCIICGKEVEKWKKNRCSEHQFKFRDTYIKNLEYYRERSKQYRIKKLLNKLSPQKGGKEVKK